MPNCDFFLSNLGFDLILNKIFSVLKIQPNANQFIQYVNSNKNNVLTIKFEVFLAGVCHQTSEISSVISQNEISIFDFLRNAAVHKLARRLPTRPRPAGGTPAGQGPRVPNGGPVLGLENEPTLAAVLERAADTVEVLLILL